MKDVSKNAQIQVLRVAPSCWKVVINNPPLNLMDASILVQFRDVVDAIEADENLRVVVFESAVDGFFLNHSDFNVDLKNVTELSQGPTDLEAWPTFSNAFRAHRLSRSQKSVDARPAMEASFRWPAT